MKQTSMMAAAFVCSLAGSALAGDQLKLISVQDLSSLCDSVNNPNYYIGNNPISVALSGDRLFVGGYNNTGSAQTGRLIKIENIFGTRAFRIFQAGSPAAPYTINMPGFRGVYGVAYRAGGGLLVNFDAGTNSTDGQLTLWDVDTQLNPILKKSSVGAYRGGVKSAWDSGWDGQGVVINGNNVGTIPAVFTNFGQIGVTGLDPASLDMDAPLFYYGDGTSNLRMDFAGGWSNTWRCLAFSGLGPVVAARESNALHIGVRRDEWNFASPGGQFVIKDPTFLQGDFDIGQRCEVIDGLPGGTLVVANNTKGLDLGSAVKFFDASANGAASPLVDTDGVTPWPSSTIASGGIYDFSWDAPNKRLAITAFGNRTVYIFEYVSPCRADFNGDGFVDIYDFTDFVTCFEGGACPAGKTADYNGDGFPDIYDFTDFVTDFETGCP